MQKSGDHIERQPLARWRDASANRRYLFVDLIRHADGDFYDCRIGGYGMPSRRFQARTFEEISLVAVTRSWAISGHWRQDFANVHTLPSLLRKRFEQFDLFGQAA